MITAVKSAIRRAVPQNAFARGVSVLVAGSAGAQLLTVLAAPVLTRLYSPEDFGLLAVYASLLGLIGVVSSLRYELAIPLPESDEEAAHVVVLSLLIVLGMTLLSLLIVVFFGASVATGLGVPEPANYLWLLPVGVLLGGAYKVFNYWAVRTKRFSTIAGTNIRQAVVSLVIQLSAFKLGGFALLIAQVVGQSVGTTSLARPALKLPVFKGISWGRLKEVSSLYKQFRVYSTLSGFTNTASLQLPIILLTLFFSPLVAGLYSLTSRVLLVPISLVGAAIGQVVFGDAALAFRDSREKELFLRTFKILTTLAAPMLILIWVDAPGIFSTLFGEEWRDSGIFAQWMAVWFFFQFVSSPISSIITARLLENLAFYWHLSLLILRCGALFIGFFVKDLMLAIELFSGVSALMYLVYLWWISRLCSTSFIEVITTLARVLLVCGFYFLPFFVIDLLTVEESRGVLLEIGIFVMSALLYYFRNLKSFWSQVD